MTTEEKAKAYDEAIEKAESLYKVSEPMSGCNVLLETVFPELAESEDERIKKWLIALIRSNEYGSISDVGYMPCPKHRVLAWLEKQGTPAKLSEEEQNRFAKGVLTSCALSFIDYLDAHKNEGKMCVSNGECEDIENAFHNAMWDRLHRYYCKYIEKQGEQKPTDEEIKELLRTEYEKGRADVIAEKSWSEEDEKQLNNIMWIIEAYRKNGFNETHIQIADNSENWLKSLKDRVQSQPKPEWREEDEKMCQETIDWFEKKCFPYALESENPARESINWLKSLRPHSQWKPSEEQIEILDIVLTNESMDYNVAGILRELRGQLKKLKEE